MSVVCIGHKQEIGDEPQAIAAHNILMTNDKGEPIHGVCEVKMHIRPDEVVRMELLVNAFISEPIMGKPTFMAYHPRTGEKKEISKVEFADGSTWDCRFGVSPKALNDGVETVDVTGIGEEWRRFAHGCSVRQRLRNLKDDIQGEDKGGE